MADILTIPEIAARWRCTPLTVRRMIDGGRLNAFRVGDRYRVLLSEVERYEGREGGNHETDVEKALAALDG